MSDSAGHSGSKVLSFTAYQDTGKTLVLNSAVSPRVSALGSAVTFKAKSTGGVLPVTYTYKIGKINGEYKTVLSKTALDSLNYKPTEPGYYNLKVIATDYKNNTTEKTATFIVTNNTGESPGVDVTVESPALVDSYLEIKAAGKGGTAPYKYLYYYRQKGTTSWKQIKADRYTGTARFSADSMGSYEILTKTYDYNGSIYRKITSVSVYKDTGTPLVNNSTISSSVINQGGSITLTAKAEGGAVPYFSYSYYCRLNGGDWQLLNSGSACFTYKTTAAGEAEFRVDVKDGKKTVAK